SREAPDGSGQSRNFVMCPGGAYDRSPCGTGTSAKLACLAADGKLGEGETWVQQGILGSVFESTYRAGGRGVLPRITGRAWITGRAEILIEADDPFAWGIRGTLLPEWAATTSSSSAPGSSAPAAPSGRWPTAAGWRSSRPASPGAGSRPRRWGTWWRWTTTRPNWP